MTLPLALAYMTDRDFCTPVKAGVFNLHVFMGSWCVSSFWGPHQDPPGDLVPVCREELAL